MKVYLHLRLPYVTPNNNFPERSFHKNQNLETIFPKTLYTHGIIYENAFFFLSKN